MKSTVIFILMFALLSLAGCGGSSSSTEPVPTIAGFTPTSGPAGTTVTITGTNFSATAANNQVKFNGMAAIVVTASATQLVVTVPAGVTPGPVTVTTNGRTATSAVNFIPLAAGTALMGGTIQGSTLAVANPVTASTIAGSAGAIGSADGVGAAARFADPTRITTDGTNLYVSDIATKTIRKIVIATGAVTTVAGTAGVSGSLDGMGAAAQFDAPYGITTDGTNLYVTDFDKVRKVVIATGAVTTLAGTAGVFGAADGIGAAASFYALTAITTDGKNLYVTESLNNTIRKIDIATRAVTTIAGTAGVAGSLDGTGAVASFNGPYGITTDGTNLYVADYGNNKIRKIVIATGTVSTLNLAMESPTDVTTDGVDIYATYRDYTVRKIALTNGVASTIAGTGGSLGGTGITTDGTSLYVADKGNKTILRLN